MAVWVTCAQRDVEIETLPVVKLTQWYGTPGRDTVYAYARLCFCRGGLWLQMTVFDGAPPATQTAQALLQLGDRWLHLCFAADGQASCRCGDADIPLPAGACAFGAGQDEQGWYWQATCRLDAAFLARCGATAPRPGQTFAGALFLQDALEEAFGSAFALPPAQPCRPQNCLGQFAVAQ